MANNIGGAWVGLTSIEARRTMNQVDRLDGWYWVDFVPLPIKLLSHTKQECMDPPVSSFQYTCVLFFFEKETLCGSALLGCGCKAATKYELLVLFSSSLKNNDSITTGLIIKPYVYSLFIDTCDLFVIVINVEKKMENCICSLLNLFCTSFSFYLF